MAVLLMHCNQVKSVLELAAFSLICSIVLAFLTGGAVSALLATGASAPLPEAIAVPLAEAITTHFFSTSRQATWFACFPTTFVHLATCQAKNKRNVIRSTELSPGCATDKFANLQGNNTQSKECIPKHLLL